MGRFISTVKIPGGDKIIDFALPLRGIGSVNLICGENCVGKSYILQQLEMIYRSGKNGEGSPGFELSYQTCDDGLSDEKALYYGKIWKLKDKCASFHFTTQKNKGADPTDGPANLYENTLKFLYELVFHENKLDICEKDFSNIENMDLRLKLIEETISDKNGEICYPCNPAHPLVRQIETAISNRRLYYRFYHEKKEQICMEFVFTTPDGRITTQSKWSDGQKSVFYLLLNLYYQNSSVIILDEIENHLHPNFISKILEVIKQSGRQCIVSTHHPHVIFSEYIDQVYYIELEKQDFPTKEREIINYRPSTKAFPRIITNLMTDYSKISSVYKLFDPKDMQLLHLSKYFQQEGELNLYKILESLPTANAPVSSGNSVLPDKQTRMVYDEVKTAGTYSCKKWILDIGAGLGRMKEELEKNLIFSDSFLWYLLNTSEEQNQKVKELFHENQNVFPVMNYEQIPDGKFDIVIVANVVHEITPPSFAEIINESQKKLKPEGRMIILDMEPLLHAEQYAVPYSSGELVTLFNNLGWAATFKVISHKFVMLYEIYAQKVNTNQLSCAEICVEIEKLWAQKYKNALAGYLVMQNKELSYNEYQKKLQDMATIASIGSYFEKMWK